MLASTTGNITGGYDMGGGAIDYTMGSMANSTGAFYPSGSGFTSAPESKYYDKYVYGTSDLTHERGKLGDATKETLKTFGNSYGGWYSGSTSFLNTSNSWFLRGSSFDAGTFANVFTFGRSSRSTMDANYYSTRAILVRK